MRSGRKQTYSVLCDGGDKVYKDGKIWLALNDAGEEICLLPGKANRHTAWSPERPAQARL